MLFTYDALTPSARASMLAVKIDSSELSCNCADNEKDHRQWWWICARHGPIEKPRPCVCRCGKHRLVEEERSSEQRSPAFYSTDVASF